MMPTVIACRGGAPQGEGGAPPTRSYRAKAREKGDVLGGRVGWGAANLERARKVERIRKGEIAVGL